MFVIIESYRGYSDMKLKEVPIDVIARFRVNGSGIPSPYKFRYKDEHGNTYDVKIDHIYHVKDHRFAGKRSFIYRCVSTIADEEMMYELRYYVDECQWQLYKM